MMEQTTKPRRIKPYTARWHKMADQLARSASPLIYPCAKCQRPVIDGYVCSTCGTNDPRSE